MRSNCLIIARALNSVSLTCFGHLIPRGFCDQPAQVLTMPGSLVWCFSPRSFAANMVIFYGIWRVHQLGIPNMDCIFGKIREMNDDWGYNSMKWRPSYTAWWFTSIYSGKIAQTSNDWCWRVVESGEPTKKTVKEWWRLDDTWNTLCFNRAMEAMAQF